MTIFTNKSEFSYVEEKNKVLALLLKAQAEAEAEGRATELDNSSYVSIAEIHRATKIPYPDLHVVLKQLCDSFAIIEEFIGPKVCYSIVKKLH